MIFKKNVDGVDLACFLRDYRDAVAKAQEVEDIYYSFPYVDYDGLLNGCIELLKLGDELYNAATYNDSQGGSNGERLQKAVAAIKAFQQA